MLSKALIKLSRFPTIPPVYLTGTLAGQPFPIQMWVAQEDDTKSLGEFWSSLGMPPRSSFHLMATIAMDLAIAEVEGPPVTTSEIVLDNDLDVAMPGEPIFTIGGVVRDGGTALPVAEATVTVKGGRSTTTDAEGRFRLSGLLEGTHKLTAEATGFALVKRMSTCRPPPSMTTTSIFKEAHAVSD